MQPMKFKSPLSYSSVEVQGIRGVILTDIIWSGDADGRKNSEKYLMNNDAFASYYKTENVIVEWSVRLVDKRAGFYMEFVIHKITGEHVCEFERDDVDDQEIEFEINDDIDSKWEIVAQQYFYRNTALYADMENETLWAKQELPRAMFIKGLEIDYSDKKCVIYLGK